MNPTLDQIDRRLMLANAWTKVRHHFRGVPLWVFVRDICGCGSTSAIAICEECGWDPHATHTHRLTYGNLTPTDQTVRPGLPG